jgi:alkylation response protein AidB-like acyl-CoA dehydrogenase
MTTQMERAGDERADDELAALAAEVHAFLSARVPRRRHAHAGWGEGTDAVMALSTLRGEAELAELEVAKAWQRDLYDAGLAWVDGPTAYGGRGLDAECARLVRRIVAEYEAPLTSHFMVSFDIVGPTILAHGTAEQKARWLPSVWRGETVCCQLFSEPEAGSDLASLRATAVRDGDEWVIQGQKVWSSGAHYSQLGELLARTGTTADRNRGITAFLVEMDRPGIEVRPLRQMNGNEHFNEVFFDDVRIPDSNRLGPVNGGWAVAQTTLGGERAFISDENSGILNDPVRKLFALAAHTGAFADAAIREQLAEAWARQQILQTTGDRLEGSEPPPESVIKLQMGENMEFFYSVAGRMLGPRMTVDTGAWGTYAWSDLLLGAPAHRIAGGSDEIQRNIIAERLLGLPREPRP